MFWKINSQVNRPQIKGLEKFTKNSILHTAEWPKDLDYTTAFKDERMWVHFRQFQGFLRRQKLIGLVESQVRLSVLAQVDYKQSVPFPLFQNLSTSSLGASFGSRHLLWRDLRDLEESGNLETSNVRFSLFFSLLVTRYSNKLVEIDSEEEKEKYRTDPDALYGHIKALSIAANPSFGTFG